MTETSYASPNKEEINSSSNSSSPTMTKSTNPYREISSSDDENEIPTSEVHQFLDQASGLVKHIKSNIEKEEYPLPDMPHVISKGKFFNMTKFRDTVSEVVTQIPFDVDEKQMYLIDCCELESNQWQQKNRDGRYFNLNTSKHKGFRGVRRIGKCLGNYQCSNEECPLYKSTGSFNKHHFKTIGGEKFCHSCDILAERKVCGTLKLIEYSPSTKMLVIYNDGKHRCTPKIQTTNDDAIQAAIEESGGNIGPRELARLKMTQELNKQKLEGVHDMGAIVNIASQLTDTKRIANIKKKITHLEGKSNHCQLLVS